MARTPRQRQYALFAQSRCGHIYGYVEHSFSMGWRKDYVRVWNKESAIAYLNEFNQKHKHLKVYRSSKDDGEFLLYANSVDMDDNHEIVKFFLVRVNDANSPIQINMKDRRTASKFYWRNRPFKRIPQTEESAQ